MKLQPNDLDMWAPQNITEYLFCDDNGEMIDDINSKDVDQIYDDYVRVLTGMYERLRGKFNHFASKCLSEKQKRESGLVLTAPPLTMPSEEEQRIDKEKGGEKDPS